MNLAVWAGRNGVSRVTAYPSFHAGLVPVPAPKVGRLILVDEGERDDARWQTAVYARVSWADQKVDLDRLVAQVTAWATAQQILVDKIVVEVRSALDGHRPHPCDAGRPVGAADRGRAPGSVLPVWIESLAEPRWPRGAVS